MQALIVRGRGEVPVVTDFPDPVAGPGEEVVQILAAGVHQVVRAMAAGTHYGSPTVFPFVPGVDAIARLADGRRAYVGYARAPYGTLSAATVIPAGWAIPIPSESLVADSVFAGSMNPLASVWMAVVHRAELKPGERVLILGATGASGRLAVELAFAYGAGSVVAAGRKTDVLQQLSRDHRARIVQLRGGAADMAATLGAAVEGGVDVIIDYLWGEPAEAAITAITRSGMGHHAKAVRYVQVGEMAGSTLTLPAAVLRSSGLHLLGSGAGSVDPKVIAAAIPELIEKVATGAIGVSVVEVPLAEAGDYWSKDLGGRRMVVVP